ncbi:hypothetical protein [Brachybacterium vulturis]|uniref:hypothetical protein n=1 Tax=Brachybacterium vulturis TaxID=2017484 RepID=UPI0037365F39
MDYEVQGFSDTGTMVFAIVMLAICAVVVVAVLGTALFARRHRFLKACGVFLAGTFLGAPVLMVATVVAMYI